MTLSGCLLIGFNLSRGKGGYVLTYDKTALQKIKDNFRAGNQLLLKLLEKL